MLDMTVPPPPEIKALAFAYFGVLAPPARSLGEVATAAVSDPAFLATLDGPAASQQAATTVLPLVGYAIDQQYDDALDHHCRCQPAATVVYDTLLASSGEAPSEEVVARVVDTFGMWEAQPVADGAADVVRGVRDVGYPIGLVANCVMPGRCVRDRVAEAGLGMVFDPILLASEWGWCMPHVSVFRELLEGLECNPEDVLLVCGDFRTHVHGAEAVGLRTAWLHAELPERAQQVEDSYLIRDLEVLLDWFGGTV